MTINPQATTGTIPDDRDARLVRIRQRQILLAFEQHGPGYQRVTGDGCRYVAEIVKATRDEWDWIYTHGRTHPEALTDTGPVRNPQQWDDLRREQGETAFTAAQTAFDAGDHAAALDHLDEARALGVLPEESWDRLRNHILAAAGGAR
ncbi:hypothetical protein BDK92_2620 [Micromonospora pisi]|uniref:Uncharacterized protein n=1 Tax=Micromonospora pisi TaxID=589240 RepID=A0A495JJZ1_9ACTN|nr:hypothetical protein BDK92_2620 [Micromonospora pisi]